MLLISLARNDCLRRWGGCWLGNRSGLFADSAQARETLDLSL
jgi:hypothetical protein